MARPPVEIIVNRKGSKGVKKIIVLRPSLKQDWTPNWKLSAPRWTIVIRSEGQIIQSGVYFGQLWQAQEVADSFDDAWVRERKL